MKKFLIIRWSGMGDIIMTLPAIQWLKNRFPESHICYLTDSAFAKIPELSGLVDEVFPIDRRGFKKLSSLRPAAWGVFKTLIALRFRAFDMAFDLQGFGETAILARLSGTDQRVGRIKGSPLRRRIYNIPITGDWEKEHRTTYFVRAVANAFGKTPPTGESFPTLNPPKKKTPQTNSQTPGLIGLNIGASTESRRWSEENFLQLAQMLSEKGHGIRIFAGPEEKSLRPIFQRACSENDWDLSCHADFDDFIADLCDCQLLVSNDTGPGHLAAAFGLPVVTLFSTGTPENVAPMAEKYAWFREEEDINRIRVDDVAQACFDLLNLGLLNFLFIE